MNTIIWKGVPSTTIDGLLISELPSISKPPMRVKETTIDGKDGSIIEELGYASYDKPITIGLRGSYDIDRVIKYFTGEGELIFSNEPEKVYTAKVISQIDYNRLVRFRTAVVTFRVQPYKHKYNEAYKETQTATATGTNILLKDSGRTPMRIETEAEEVVVHGKNLFNAHNLKKEANTSLDISNDGYEITVVGGSAKEYAASRYDLPLSMRGKSYVVKCDEVTYTESPSATVQVAFVSPTNSKHFGISNTIKLSGFTIPEDATSVFVGVWTNNTATKLAKDNVVTVKGLQIVPSEYKTDTWCPFDGLQTLEVVDGVAEATGYDSVTVISNADNAEMTVAYTKRYEVFNQGLESSKPKMVLHGTGTVGISVNGIHIFDYTFPEGETEVVIDSEKEDAYLGEVLKNRNMNGEFPVLLAGTNIIEWSGDVESIEILPRSRWL